MKKKFDSPIKIYNNKNSQMILLMGVVLAISVFSISALTTEIANIDIVVTTERSRSLQDEFTTIKETFPFSLNYNLAENITMENNEIIFYGNISNITAAFNQTKNEYYILELQHDNIFNAELVTYWYAHPGGINYIYYVSVILTLENENSIITENVDYSIECRPYIPP
jgi:hypothetical protein